MCWRGRIKSLSNGSTLLTAKDMKKKITVFAVSAMLFALCGSVDAQQPKKLPRIGYLTSTSPSSQSANREAFQQSLRELGYTEGKNILIEWRAAEGNRNRQRELAAELVRLQVDVIVEPLRQLPWWPRVLPAQFRSFFSALRNLSHLA